jgi:hypothetical protein
MIELHLENGRRINQLYIYSKNAPTLIHSNPLPFNCTEKEPEIQYSHKNFATKQNRNERLKKGTYLLAVVLHRFLCYEEL